jgi:N-methylhydantoinase B
VTPDSHPAFQSRTGLVTRLQLEELAAAMDATLRRAATTASIGYHGSTAAGFYTPTGSLLLCGRESHPLLMEAAAEALAFLVKAHAAAGRSFVSGEIYGTNDPGCNAAGLEDLILAAPVVRGERLLGFVALTASHPSLGHATLAPVERLRLEGIVLPWIRLGSAGRPSGDAMALLVANTDDPAAFRENLAAHLHALDLGRTALDDLLDREGPEILAELAEVAVVGARRALSQNFARLEAAEIGGRTVHFAVHIRRDGDPLPVRVEPIDPAHRFDLTPALARAAVRAAFREVLSAESPTLAILGGLTETLSIEATPDNSPDSRPAGEARFAGAQAVLSTVLAAFAGVLSHLTHAADAACLLMDLRGQRDDGSRFRARLGLPGGLGASVFGDGLTYSTPQFAPHRTRAIEEIERTLPIRIHRLQLIPDSGGPGQYRGGLAAALEIELLEGLAEADLLVPERATGLQGGLRGADARAIHITPRHGSRVIREPGRVAIRLEAGDRLVLEGSGGGGWGIPFQRAFMRLDEDVHAGLIGPDQARNRYGLILKPNSLEKDDYLTYRVRHYLLSMLTVEDIIAGEELLD